MWKPLTLVLLLAAPPVSDDPAPVPAGEAEGPAAPPSKVEGPAAVDPDAPDAPPPDAPPPALSPDPEQPGASSSIPPNSRGGSGGSPWGTPASPTTSPSPGPSPSPGYPPPAEYEYPERDLADLPFGATAARKSAVQRNNDVLVRPFNRPVYSIAASGRFGTLLGGGTDIMQPFGYGFAAQLRIHFAAVVRSRFGVEVHAGHTRFSQRKSYEGFDESSPITRTTLLTDTDFSAGPSMQIPLGPLFLQFGGSAGVALSTLFRPQSAEVSDDEQVSTSNFMLRGGASIGVPVLNRHGLTIGAGVHHIFSPREVVIDPQAAEPETTRPFGTWLEVLLGYQIWF
ncbi:hypothetical protein [Enhygromyxa salina]|uniref:hypothetical protein n=1 Tax=Enhygromyxa salina TaxID=215803 RepID=UPI0011BA71D3|nr:hypothetical protein [Enhygromyxa salina]